MALQDELHVRWTGAESRMTEDQVVLSVDIVTEQSKFILSSMDLPFHYSQKRRAVSFKYNSSLKVCTSSFSLHSTAEQNENFCKLISKYRCEKEFPGHGRNANVHVEPDGNLVLNSTKDVEKNCQNMINKAKSTLSDTDERSNFLLPHSLWADFKKSSWGSCYLYYHSFADAYWWQHTFASC